MAVCIEIPSQLKGLHHPSRRVPTDLALDIPDEQFHVIRPIILVGLLSRSGRHGGGKLLRTRCDKQPAGPRRRCPRGHAHVETVRHATPTREQRSLGQIVVSLMLLLLVLMRVRASRGPGDGPSGVRRHRSSQRQAAQHARHAPRVPMSPLLSSLMMMRSFSFPVDQGEIQIESIGQGRGSFGTSGVGRDDDPVPPPVDLGLDIPDHGHLGQEVVTGDIKEPLDLRGVQIHGDDVITPGYGEQVGDESAERRPVEGSTTGFLGTSSPGLTWR